MDNDTVPSTWRCSGKPVLPVVCLIASKIHPGLQLSTRTTSISRSISLSNTGMYVIDIVGLSSCQLSVLLQ
jgi:hypothetical protein